MVEKVPGSYEADMRAVMSSFLQSPCDPMKLERYHFRYMLAAIPV